MKSPIKIGGRYWRSNLKHPFYLLDEFDKCLPDAIEETDIIVILEVFNHTSQGNKLRGKKNFRAKILTPKGRICYLYGSLHEWEEVGY